jgi:hypothetical protein
MADLRWDIAEGFAQQRSQRFSRTTIFQSSLRADEAICPAISVTDHPKAATADPKNVL